MNQTSVLQHIEAETHIRWREDWTPPGETAASASASGGGSSSLEWWQEDGIKNHGLKRSGDSFVCTWCDATLTNETSYQAHIGSNKHKKAKAWLEQNIFKSESTKFECKIPNA